MATTFNWHPLGDDASGDFFPECARPRCHRLTVARYVAPGKWVREQDECDRHSKRTYRRINPADHRVMYRLHTEYSLTYPQIADLWGCSRSRVAQIITRYSSRTVEVPASGSVIDPS